MNTKFKIAIIIFIQIATSTIFSQDYIKYSTRINEAEYFIINKNYERALGIYDSLFNEYEFIYARNAFTACQLAAYISDSLIFEKCLDKCFLAGIDINVLSISPIISKMKSKNEWISTIPRYRILNQKYISKIDTILKKRVDNLSAIDQKYTRRCNMFFGFAYPFFYRKANKTYSQLVDSLLLIYNEKGVLPHERNIGISFKYNLSVKKDSLNIIKGNFDFSNQKVILILLHNQSNEKLIKSNFLLENLEKGYLKPDDYASIIDFYAKYGSNNDFKNISYNQHFRDYDSTNWININNRRKIIGLESFELLRAKEQRSIDILKTSIINCDYNYIKLWKRFY